MTMEFLWNSKGILIRILFKIEMTMELFKYFVQNFFQELDDHRILMKFFEDFNQNSDDQRILLKFFNDFDLIFFDN